MRDRVLNLFEWHQEASSDSPQTPPASIETPVSKPAGKDVDLFPALADKKTLALVAPRAAATSPQISMFVPSNFEEALEIVECLRSRASTTVCLDKMRKNDAHRLVDFVSGAAAAIDGKFHRLSEQVYVFAPSNVEIVVRGKELNGGSKAQTIDPLDFLYADGKTLSRNPLNNVWTRGLS